MASVLPILLLGGAAVMLLGKKKPKKKAAAKAKECPEGQVWSEDAGKCIPHIAPPSCPERLDIKPLSPDDFRGIAKATWEKNNGDAIRTADVLFRSIVPQGCTKKDFKTIVSGPNAKEAFVEGYNLSMLYATIVSATLEENLDIDDPRDLEHARFVMGNIATWYSSLTGEPLPDID